MIEYTAAEGISVRVIKDSISKDGIRLISFEFDFPRFILSELNTHRMLSKNSSSSRAIPVKTMLDNILSSPAMPVYWGKNQSGMTAKEELQGVDLQTAKSIWAAAMSDVAKYAHTLGTKIQTHKQIANRILEPWMRQRAIISGTEWANLFWLRDHPDAQPEFRELAHAARICYDRSTPTFVGPGSWHLPYVEDTSLPLEDAKSISMSCAAQVSYRKNDESLEKARKIVGMLNLESKTEPAHMSPTEHQATPMQTINGIGVKPEFWEHGVTHMDRQGVLWSGNLRGWVQNRKLYDNEARW